MSEKNIIIVELDDYNGKTSNRKEVYFSNLSSAEKYLTDIGYVKSLNWLDQEVWKLDYFQTAQIRAQMMEADLS